MKKILFASRKGHVPYAEGGGEVIAFDLLSEIQKSEKGSVKALGSFQYIDLQPLNLHLKQINTNLMLSQQGADLETLDGSQVKYPSFSHAEYQMQDAYPTTLARDDHYFISFDEYLKQYAPDICLLQAEGAIECWQKLRQVENCKTLFYVQNGYELNAFRGIQVEKPKCLANSKFVQEKIKKEHKTDSELLYPAIDCSRYRLKEARNKNQEGPLKVLFVNPNNVKGLGVFLKMAERFKNVQFFALEGWAPIDDSLYQYFQQLGNVTYITKTWDMASVYQNADLLIAPSQWEEAFGRVIVEAHAAELPTLASKIGGLPEATGDAGFLVEDYQNADAWIDTLSQFVNNPKLLREKDGAMESNVQRFTPQVAAERFMEIANSF